MAVVSGIVTITPLVVMVKKSITFHDVPAPRSRKIKSQEGFDTLHDLQLRKIIQICRSGINASPEINLNPGISLVSAVR